MSDRVMVCSECGQPAWADSRGGSVDHILMCGCEKKVGGYWIGDRGGPDVWVSDARIISSEEFARRQAEKQGK